MPKKRVHESATESDKTYSLFFNHQLNKVHQIQDLGSEKISDPPDLVTLTRGPFTGSIISPEKYKKYLRWRIAAADCKKDCNFKEFGFVCSAIESNYC